MKKIGCALAVLGIGAGVGFFGFQQWLGGLVQPGKATKNVYVRLEKGTSFGGALRDLEEKGVIESARNFQIWAKFKGKAPILHEGTYLFKPGSKADEVLASLNKPVSRMVRIPEGWWISRVAKRLEENQVCDAEEYIKLANDPSVFAKSVKFPLPEESLEGYLYPDTYDLPPLTSAKEVITKQLKAFESKVWPKLKNAKVHRTLTVASMVQSEVAADQERPLVAGVIERRLQKGMRLQIDATVLYALGEWKVLGPGVVNKVVHPYNTYRIPGLPPGPIGSPSLASIEAALNPKATDKIFYVALPDKTHLFARTYEEHLANIRKARQAARG